MAVDDEVGSGYDSPPLILSPISKPADLPAEAPPMEPLKLDMDNLLCDSFLEDASFHSEHVGDLHSHLQDILDHRSYQLHSAPETATALTPEGVHDRAVQEIGESGSLDGSARQAESFREFLSAETVVAEEDPTPLPAVAQPPGDSTLATTAPAASVGTPASLSLTSGMIYSTTPPSTAINLTEFLSSVSASNGGMVTVKPLLTPTLSLTTTDKITFPHQTQPHQRMLQPKPAAVQQRIQLLPAKSGREAPSLPFAPTPSHAELAAHRTHVTAAGLDSGTHDTCELCRQAAAAHKQQPKKTSPLLTAPKKTAHPPSSAIPLSAADHQQQLQQQQQLFAMPGMKPITASSQTFKPRPTFSPILPAGPRSQPPALLPATPQPSDKDKEDRLKAKTSPPSMLQTTLSFPIASAPPVVAAAIVTAAISTPSPKVTRPKKQKVPLSSSATQGGLRGDQAGPAEAATINLGLLLSSSQPTLSSAPQSKGTVLSHPFPTPPISSSELSSTSTSSGSPDSTSILSPPPFSSSPSSNDTPSPPPSSSLPSQPSSPVAPRHPENSTSVNSQGNSKLSQTTKLTRAQSQASRASRRKLSLDEQTFFSRNVDSERTKFVNPAEISSRNASPHQSKSHSRVGSRASSPLNSPPLAPTSSLKRQAPEEEDPEDYFSARSRTSEARTSVAEKRRKSDSSLFTKTNRDPKPVTAAAETQSKQLESKEDSLAPGPSQADKADAGRREGLVNTLNSLHSCLRNHSHHLLTAQCEALQEYADHLSKQAYDRIEAKFADSQLESTVLFASRISSRSKVEDVLKLPKDWPFTGEERLSLVTCLAKLRQLNDTLNDDVTDCSSDDGEDFDNPQYLASIEHTRR